MARRRGKRKKTPKRLDYLFKRHLIDEAAYRDFWGAYWEAATDIDRQKVVAEFTEEHEKAPEPKPKPKRKRRRLPKRDKRGRFIKSKKRKPAKRKKRK